MEKPSGRAATRWAASALVLTSIVAIAAKIAGVVVAPGVRGVGSQATVTLVEAVSGTLAYALMALLVALVCGASFELARARSVGLVARGSVVAVSGLIVALASPAVVERLHAVPTLALGGVTGLLALVAGVVVLRAPETRAVGGVLTLLALCGLLRVVAWATSAISLDRASVSLYELSRGMATAAVTLQVLAALLAAAWIGTRSLRGRVLSNTAILVAFGVTWLAARGASPPSAIEAVLRSSLPAAAGAPAPYLIGAIGAFLVPASILLAVVALVQRREPPALVAPLALALLSHGAFDVPLQAMLVTASAEWAMLAMADRARPGAAARGLPPTAPASTKPA